MSENKRRPHNWIEPEKKICLGCKKEFLTKKRTKKYCTQPCWTKHNNRKDSDEVKKKRAESVRKTMATLEYKNKIANSESVKEGHKKLSKTLKRKIALGEFTPNITNSWTSWEAYLNIGDKKKKFRSSWEAVFYFFNQNLYYETIRIPYKYNNSISSYIVDFEDRQNRVLYEIKPKSLKDDEKNIKKIEAAIDWCKKNSYTFIIVDDDWFKKNIQYFDFNLNPHLKNKMKQFLND